MMHMTYMLKYLYAKVYMYRERLSILNFDIFHHISCQHAANNCHFAQQIVSRGIFNCTLLLKVKFHCSSMQLKVHAAALEHVLAASSPAPFTC